MGTRAIGLKTIGIRKPVASSDLFSTYWTTLISAVVEDAAPTKVVMTFDKANTSLLATDFSIAGKTITLIERDATNKILTLTVSAAFVYGDVLTVALKSYTPHAITNNVLYAMTITSGGDGIGILKMEVSSNIEVTLSANGKFYTDAAATQNESSTWNIVAGDMRAIYIKCTSGTSIMKFSDASKITKWGDVNPFVNGWESFAYNNAPILNAKTSSLLLQSLYLFSVNMVVNDRLSNGLQKIYLRDITWSYAGILPQGLTYLFFNGNSIDWTGPDLSGSGNITTLNLTNYRTNKMSSADMVTLLTSLKNRVGTLPATITINDYADFAAPPQAVVDAVAALKLAKSITTVTLGA